MCVYAVFISNSPIKLIKWEISATTNFHIDKFYFKQLQRTTKIEF